MRTVINNTESHDHEEPQGTHDSLSHEEHPAEEPHTDTTTPAVEDHTGHSHSGTGDLWGDYFQLLTDPSHFLYELTFTVVFDLLIVAFLYGIIVKQVIIPRLRKSIHAEIHAEHGDEHCEVVTPADTSDVDKNPTS